MYVFTYMCIYISSGFGPGLGLGQGKPKPGFNKFGPSTWALTLIGPSSSRTWASLNTCSTLIWMSRFEWIRKGIWESKKHKGIENIRKGIKCNTIIRIGIWLPINKKQFFWNPQEINSQHNIEEFPPDLVTNLTFWDGKGKQKQIHKDGFHWICT